MPNLFRRIALTLLAALVPALFCALMTSAISVGLPQACPEGSKVIGIECFDAAYNNTTPWYRRDLNPSFVSFPLWMVVALVVAWGFTAPRPVSSDYVPAAELDSVTDGSPAPVSMPAAKADPDADKRWLPTQCPQCGGALAINAVEWITSFEARCPYCGSVLKA